MIRLTRNKSRGSSFKPEAADLVQLMAAFIEAIARNSPLINELSRHWESDQGAAKQAIKAESLPSTQLKAFH